MWRVDDPVLSDKREIILGGLWPTGRKAWQSNKFVKFLCTGYGFGKTLLLCKRAIASALENAPIPVMIVSPSFRMAKRTVIPALTFLMKGRAIHFVHHRSDGTMEITYGGRTGNIWFGSAEIEDSLKGPNLAAVFVDEALLIPWSAVEILLSRVRDPKAKFLELFMVGTPEGGVASWLWDILHGGGKTELDIEIFTGSTRENKALPPSFVKMLESAYDEKTKAAYVDGKLVNMAEGIVYHAFDSAKNVIAMDDPDPEGAICCGIDFNHNPLCYVLFWFRNGHMHIFREEEMKESDTVEAVCDAWNFAGARLKTFYPDPSGIQKRTSAVGGVTDISLIKTTGEGLTGKPFSIKARRRTPPRRDRFNAANAMFKNMALTIDPSCKKLIKCLTLLTFKNYGGKNGEDDYTHFPDAATYACEIECPIINAVKGQRQRWYTRQDSVSVLSQENVDQRAVG